METNNPQRCNVKNPNNVDFENDRKNTEIQKIDNPKK